MSRLFHGTPSKQLVRFDLTLLSFLVVEFLDEPLLGTREAAWPIIRTDPGLTYVQIGSNCSHEVRDRNPAQPTRCDQYTKR